MLFNSHIFIFLFFPIVCLGFVLIRRYASKFTASWLLLASIVFYGWWSLHDLQLMIISISFNFVVATLMRSRFIEEVHSEYQYHRKILLIVGIIGNLLFLGYFKYLGFFESVFDHTITYSSSDSIKNLPLGISFYTFTQIAFLVDSYSKDADKENGITYPLFVSYFPHLLAGPILNHKDMLPQSKGIHRQKITSTMVAVGLCIFIIGLFKKTVIADSLAPIVDKAFAAIPLDAAITAFSAWLGVLAYTMQIYFDFSGYSDMAFGVSMLLGIRIPINFLSPYQSASIVEFWRRWHISLSVFLREYLYIKLGGNRQGAVRRYINLMLTMLLGGLWHGAGWQFIIWGGLHGFYLIVCHLWQAITKKLVFKSWRVWKVVSAGITFFCVVFAWVFFRADNVPHALFILKGMTQHVTYEQTLSDICASERRLDLLLLISSMMIAIFLPNTYEVFSKHLLPSCVQNTPPPSRFEWLPSKKSAVFFGVMAFFSIVFITRESKFLYFQF
jgi:alginate O-acetyltransferase complex protein AlgI